MPVDPIQIIDPEVVIPSPASAGNRHFWMRLLSWIEEGDERTFVGPTTLVGLQKLADQRPDESVLQSDAFWMILGKLAPRTFHPSEVQRDICERHIRNDYSPVLGHVQNVDRLVQDLQAVGNDPHLALQTLEECWNVHTRDCHDCRKSRLHKIPSSPGHTTASSSMARVWRSACLDEQGSDLKALQELSPRMFPGLKFSDSAWKHLNTLSGSPTDNLKALVLHLGVLNDHARRIWSEEPTTPGRQARLGALDVLASPESSQTRKNSKAMQRREFNFSQNSVQCEWHTKLRPNINRVYFAVSDDGVYVGTIVDHLPT